jgi:hypothetical protein
VAFTVELKWMQDDPVCVAARRDGKKVVTELWVDDSLDTGAMADADRVSQSCYCACICTAVNLIQLFCIWHFATLVAYYCKIVCVTNKPSKSSLC